MAGDPDSDSLLEATRIKAKESERRDRESERPGHIGGEKVVSDGGKERQKRRGEGV